MILSIKDKPSNIELVGAKIPLGSTTGDLRGCLKYHDMMKEQAIHLVCVVGIYVFCYIIHTVKDVLDCATQGQTVAR